MKSGFTVSLVPSSFLMNRWVEISALMNRVFAESEFSEGFYAERPTEFTFAEISGSRANYLEHVIALDTDDKFVGGILCLRTVPPIDGVSADVGWFFVDTSLPPLARMSVGDSLFTQTAAALANAGYQFVATEMGTQKGEDFLSKRHHMIPAPLDCKSNRWLLNLMSDDYDLNVSSAVVTDPSGLGRRVATRALDQNACIVDLKRVLKRLNSKTEDSLEVGTGYHFGCDEILGLSTSENPNAFIEYQDLTLRALLPIKAGEKITLLRKE
jgi:hypothetical protein